MSRKVRRGRPADPRCGYSVGIAGRPVDLTSVHKNGHKCLLAQDMSQFDSDFLSNDSLPSAANWNCYATRSRIFSVFVGSMSSRQVLGRLAVGVWMGRPV